MKVEYLSKFSKDLDDIKSKSTKNSILKIIFEVQNASSQKDIKNIKKLKGYKYAFRIRSGQFRVGVFIEKGTIQFARIKHRKEIYKLFP